MMQQPVEAATVRQARSPAARAVAMTSRHPSTVGGFTLIEVLIVTAIIGILAAIGYPSYSAYVIESRRSDAHLTLLSESQAMERCKSTKYSYEDCTLSNTSSVEGYYTMSLEKAASTFKITATAKSTGLQSSDSDCQTITLDHLSTRGPRTATTKSVCWK